MVRRNAAPGLVGLVLLAGGAHAQLASTPVALTGTSGVLGPGLGEGVTFGGTSTLGAASASINMAGDVIFRASDNTAPTANTGVWLHSAGVNSVLAFNGQSAGGFTYGNAGFNSPQINNAGQTAWRYSTTALFGNTVLTAKTAAGSPTSEAPDTGGATFGSFTFPAPLLNAAGENAFVGSLTNGTGSPAVTISPAATANGAGIWSGAPGDTHLRIRQNDLFPGSAPSDDLRIGTFGGSVAFNAGGQILTAANLQGTVSSASGSANNGAILKFTPGVGVTPVARRGDAAPGSPGEFYNGITSTTTLDMNSAGQVVFNSPLRNAASGGTQTAASALFSDNGGSMTMLARAGSAMPAVANGADLAGVNWGTVFSSNVINRAGTVLFQNSGMTGAGLNSGNNAGMFRVDNLGVVTKVVRLGDTAPVISPVAGDTVLFSTLQSSPAFNALGQTAFITSLTSLLGGVSSSMGNNQALFAADSNGLIALVAQKGALFHVAPGDDRTVSTIGFIGGGGNDDGRASGLSDSGLLVFSLDFSDGSSGIFTTSVPTPGSMMLLALAGFTVLRRRR